MKYVIFAVSSLISVRQDLPHFAVALLPQLFSVVVKFAAKIRESRFQSKVDPVLLESLRGSDEIEDGDLGIYSDTQDLYDSPVEPMFGNELLRSMVIEMAKNSPEFSQGLVRSLDPHRQASVSYTHPPSPRDS